MKKAILFIGFLTGFSIALSAQNVADLARKERAHRESVTGRHAAVIRNVDLMRVQKASAVEISYPDAEIGEISGNEGQVLAQGAAGTEGAGLSEVSPGAAVASSPEAMTSESPSGAASVEESAPGPRGAAAVALETQLSAARDLVDLQTTKINSLRQQYEFQDAMVPGFVIQEQLVETEKRLMKAQIQLARIEAQIAKSGPGSKPPAEPER